MGRMKKDDGYSCAQARYDATKTTRISLKLCNNTDGDILQYLASVDNKQGLIKKLIRAYIAETVKTE